MRNLKIKNLCRVAFAVALSASLFASGCSDDDDPTTPPDTFAAPSNLTFTNDDGKVSLKWTKSADDDQGFDEFEGYNIYKSSTSMVGLSDSELTDRLADAVSPGAESGVVNNLTNGDLVYLTVRAGHSNGSLSDGPEVLTASVNTGSETVSEFASSSPSGMDFSTGVAVSQADSLARELVDFYVGTSADGDASTGELTLKSPSLLSNEWKVCGFKEVSGPDVSTTSADGFIDAIALGTTAAEIENRVFVMKFASTVGGGSVHYGKIDIANAVDFDTPGERGIRFFFTYQPAPDIPVF